MRRLAVALLTAMPVHAGPFLVSDPDPTGTAVTCVYKDGAEAAVEVPVMKDAAGKPFCRIDLANEQNGPHAVTIAFKNATVTGPSASYSYHKSVMVAPGPVITSD